MLQTSLLLALSLAGTQDLRVPRPYSEMPDVRLPAPAALHSIPAAPPRPAVVAERPGVDATAPDARGRLDLPQSAGTFQPPTVERLHFDVDGDGRHLALGRNYKASFGSEGMTFVPFLGSDAPRNFPVHFEVAAAQQGGVDGVLEPTTVARHGERFALDQGAVRTEYVVGLAAVEQLFVFDAPLGAGDLVLDVAVATELAARPNGEGWLFEGEHGAVSYGAAFVLDADGARLDLETLYTGEGLRFTVPASFLADATWPIAIDPLIATFTVDTDPRDQLQVDVAYDPSTARYIVVFEEVFSAGDHDIKSWLVDTSGNVVPLSDVYIDFTALNRTRPRVALTNARRNFLVVFVEGASGGLGRRIGARARHADTNALGTAFIVDEDTANDRLEADICGDAFPVASVAQYTVVWRRYWGANDSDVVVRIVREDGTFVTSELYVTNIIGISDEQPSISKSISPGSNDSVVVWLRRDTVTGSAVPYASLVQYDGAAVGAEFALAGSAPIDNPQVSGQSTSTLPGSIAAAFVVCWERDYFTDSDIEGVVASATATGATTPVVSPLQYISFLEHVDYLLDQVSPDVATMGDRFVVSQSAVYPGYTDYVIRSTTLNVVGLGLGVSERFVPLTQTLDETLTPKIASRYEAGEIAELGALTGWIQQQTFGQQGDVYGAIHAAAPENTCAAQYMFCFGNPNASFPDEAAFLWVAGDSSTTGTKRLEASGMTFNAFGYFLNSLTAGGGIIPPGSAGILCLGGSIGRYSNFVLNTGSAGAFSLNVNPAALSQPTGPVAALAGQTWFFQAWHRDTTAGGPPTSNFTNAAGLPFL